MKDAHGAMTRRRWLAGGIGASAGAVFSADAQSAPQGAPGRAPSAPVAIAKVRTYDEDLATVFTRMFDQIGGLEAQVRGKTVAIKVNLTGGNHFEGYTAGDTHWVHPRVVGRGYGGAGTAGGASGSGSWRAPAAGGRITSSKTSCCRAAGT